MHSFKTIAAAALLVIGVSAQEYYIRPDSVDIGIRRGWCTSQQSSCPLLCMQNAANGTSVIENSCDAATLQYECLCSNNLSPNLTEYSQTMPYFICVEYGGQCVINNCGRADTLCQSNCREDNPCGAQNPTRINVTSTTSSASSPTGTNGAGGGAVNGFDNAQPTSGSSGNGGGSSAAATAMDLGRSYGLAVVFTGIFAGFALVM